MLSRSSLRTAPASGALSLQASMILRAVLCDLRAEWRGELAPAADPFPFGYLSGASLAYVQGA